MEKQRITAAVINENSTIRHAMESLARSGLQICLVCREARLVLGVITDGDIRRGLLRGLELSSPVSLVMQTSFIHVRNDVGYHRKAELLSRRHNVNQVPILDAKGHLCDIIINSRNLRHEAKDNNVIIMAGGLGSRLRPLTEHCPKPLLPLGDRPLLESIILSFKSYGFSHFFLSINYLGDMISNYFGDGQQLEVDIRYLKEDKRLGTAGSLSLLPKKSTLPFIVINGDILMKVDMDDFLCQHMDNNVNATMCVREYNIRIPYGVVQTDGRYITAIQEKPNHTCFINTGLYCLEPDVTDLIPRDTYFDMTSLFEAIGDHGGKTGTYLLEGPWFDIGTLEDYRHACENTQSLLSMTARREF